jgi:hypothetical protein
VAGRKACIHRNGASSSHTKIMRFALISGWILPQVFGERS